MSAISPTSASVLVAQAPRALPSTVDATKYLDEFRGWVPLMNGKYDMRYQGRDSSGQRVYEVQGGKSKVRIRAASFADAEEKVKKLYESKALAPLSSGGNARQAEPKGASDEPKKSKDNSGANAVSWSKVRTRASARDVVTSTNTTFLNTWPSAQEQSSKVTQPINLTPPTLSSPAPADIPRARNPLTTGPDPTTGTAKAPARAQAPAQLKAFVEASAKANGFRSVRDLVVLPENHPGRNQKAAAWWKQTNQALYKKTDGEYGVSTEGKAGRLGTANQVIEIDKIFEKSLASSGVATTSIYTFLGAVAAFNNNIASGLSRIEALFQGPWGIFRDLANVGLSKLPFGTNNVWMDASISASGGMSVAWLSNVGANKVAELVTKKWGDDAGKKVRVDPHLGKGNVWAAFTVNFSLGTLKAMRDRGMLGLSPKSDQPPSDWKKWAMNYLPDAFAIGLGVAAAITPAARAKALAAGEPFGFKQVASTATKLTLIPATQVAVAEFIVNPPSRETGSVKKSPVVNGGNKANAAEDVRSDLIGGSNPYQLADEKRDRKDKYVTHGVPPLEMAASVLQLQEGIAQPNTPHVRTNEEAAEVIIGALNYRRGVLDLRASNSQTPTKKPVQSLLPVEKVKLLEKLVGQMDKYGYYFGSAALVKEVAAAKRDGLFSTNVSSSAKVDPAEKKFVREVFSGQIPARRNQVKQPDPLGTTVETLIGVLPFVSWTYGGAAVIAAQILAPQDAGRYSDEVSHEEQGFAKRIKNVYGTASEALGLRDSVRPALSASKRAQVDAVLMKALYLSVKHVVDAKTGSSSQPGQRALTGNYYFSAFSKMMNMRGEAAKSDLNAVKARCQKLLSGGIDRIKSMEAAQEAAREAERVRSVEAAKEAAREPTPRSDNNNRVSPSSIQSPTRGPNRPTEY